MSQDVALMLISLVLNVSAVALIGHAIMRDITKHKIKSKQPQHPHSDIVSKVKDDFDLKLLMEKIAHRERLAYILRDKELFALEEMVREEISALKQYAQQHHFEKELH